MGQKFEIANIRRQTCPQGQIFKRITKAMFALAVHCTWKIVPRDSFHNAMFLIFAVNCSVIELGCVRCCTSVRHSINVWSLALLTLLSIDDSEHLGPDGARDNFQGQFSIIFRNFPLFSVC